MPLQPILFAFSIPSLSSGLRNCSGLVVAIEFCYTADNSTFGIQQPVFHLSLFTKNNGEFVAVGRIIILSIPDGNICSSMSDTPAICCDQQNVTRPLQFPHDNFFFGIIPANLHLLQYSGELIDYKLFYTTNFDTIQVTDADLWTNGSLPLMRFLIGKGKFNKHSYII